MRTRLLILILLHSSHWLWAQKPTEQAWEDSIKSNSYIGIEVTLDEMIIQDSADSLISPNYNFYKNNPLNSTDDILSRLSGISMVRRGNYAWEPTINGLSAGQINVCIDGMRMFGACTDKMDPISSYVESNNLESIQIEKGSGGSVHGSSVGGTVSFNLKKPKFSSILSGSISSRYETVSKGFSQMASFNHGSDNFAVRLNAGFRKYNDYTDGNGNTVFPSGYSKLNLSLATSYRTKNNNLFNVDLLMDDAHDVGYPGLPMDVAFAKARIAAFSYLIWSPTPIIEQLEIKGYYNAINHLMDDSKRIDVPVRMDMPGKTQTFGAYANAILKTGRKHSVQAKVDWYSTNAYAEMTMFVPNEAEMFMLTWPDIDRHDVGLYLSDNITFNPRTSLKLNGRIEFTHSKMNDEMGKQQFSVFGYSEDDFSINQFIINSGTNLSHGLTQNLKAIIGISYGERLPSTSEQFGFYLYNNYDGYDYLGDPGISKEKSAQATLSFAYELDKKLNVSLGGFYYQFYDYIVGYIDESLDAMTIGAKGVKVYENIDGVRFTGLDANLTYSPADFFQMLYSMKVTYAGDKEGNPMPMIPPMKNYLTMVAQMKGFKLQAEAELSLSQDRINAYSGEMPTDGYYLFHLRANKSFDFSKSQLNTSFGIENLLDESYRDHLDWGNVLRPGRNYYASIEFKF